MLKAQELHINGYSSKNQQDEKKLISRNAFMRAITHKNNATPPTSTLE